MVAFVCPSCQYSIVTLDLDVKFKAVEDSSVIEKKKKNIMEVSLEPIP